MSRDETTVGGVRLTSPDKVLYPEQGITKRELAEYYLAVAGRILKHLARRPITMVRCPTGRQKTCFYQRHAGSGVPEEISQISIAGFDEPYLYIEDEAGLVALVQMGVLEVHPWNARTDRPDRPDRIVFDLDPGEGLGFADVVEAAHEVRAALDQVGLGSFAKTTGGKGIHVVAAIERTAGWDEAKAFAKALAAALAEAQPSRYLTRISKAERVGKIFIDYLRNDPTSTAVAPYSTRARPGAPVAMPLAWEELDVSLDPGRFNLRTVPKLIEQQTLEPWATIEDLHQRLPKRPA